MHKPVLPQRPTIANAEILSVEWLFEPIWPGERLVARKSSDGVDLTDERGERARPELRETADLLNNAILPERALVDGVWTAQPFLGPGGASEIESETRRAFVAVDVLELDGEPLYEVAFQERRRLLESVIVQGDGVRLGPVVKHPLAGWMNGWRELGFTHCIAKHMNSRYLPGERNEDWLKLSLQAEAPKGLMSRLLGRGGERIRRIRD